MTKKKTLFISIVLLCIMVSFSACDWFLEEKPVVRQTKKTNQIQKIVDEPDKIISQEPTVTCKEIIKNQKAITSFKMKDEDRATIVIESNKIIDELTLAKWLQSTAHDVYGDSECQILQIYFSTSVDEFSYFQGVMNKLDYQLYKKQKISEAEWVKRFEIQKMATTEAVKSRFLKARQAKDHNASLTLIDKLLEEDFNNLKAKIIKANILLDQNLYIEAAELYQIILEQHPSDVIVLFNLSYAKKMLGQFSESVMLTKKLLKLLEDEKTAKEHLALLKLTKDDLYLHLAETYLKNHELVEAEEVLDKVTNKKNPIGLILKANLLRVQHKSEEAKQILKQIIDLGEQQDIALFNMVVLHMDLQDEKAVEEYYQMLKEANPEMAKELAFVTELKKIEVQKTDLEEAMDAIPMINKEEEKKNSEEQKKDQQ